MRRLLLFTMCMACVLAVAQAPESTDVTPFIMVKGRYSCWNMFAWSMAPALSRRKIRAS